MKYIVGNKDYLMHKKHKYTFKEWVNNSWRYFYDDALGIGSKKQLEEAKKNQRLLKNNSDNLWSAYKSMDNIRNEKLKTYFDKKYDEDLLNRVGKDAWKKEVDDAWNRYQLALYNADNQESKFQKAYRKNDDNDKLIKKETKDYEKSLLGKIDKGKKIINDLLNKIYGKIGGDKLNEYNKIKNQTKLAKESHNKALDEIENAKKVSENIRKDRDLAESFTSSFFFKTDADKENHKTYSGQLDTLAKKYNYYGGTKDKKGNKYYTYNDIKDLINKIDEQKDKMDANFQKILYTSSQKGYILNDKRKKEQQLKDEYNKTMLSKLSKFKKK